jgi:hypothetical protein
MGIKHHHLGFSRIADRLPKTFGGCAVTVYTGPSPGFFLVPLFDAAVIIK